MRVLFMAIPLLTLGGGQLTAQAISFLPPGSVFYLGGSRLAEIRKLAIADFNRDGQLDIAYLTEMLSIPLSGVLFGTGGGSFRSDPSAIPGVPSGDVYAGDFDGDTNSDLIYANGSTLTRLVRGDGTGRFLDAVTIADCSRVSAIADVNGDGRQDLLCHDTVLLGQTAGVFRTMPDKLPGIVLLAADFNGDGSVDVIVRTPSGAQSLVLGRSNGTFGNVLPINASAASGSQLAADFNGDRFMDLVVLSENRTSLTFLPGKGDGTFSAPRVGPSVPGALNAAADFNGDGKLDLIAEDVLLAGNGDGTFRFPVFLGVVTDPCFAQNTTPLCDYTHRVNAVADFDNDGRPDIAAGYVTIGFSNFRGSSIAVLLNNSPGDGFLASGVSAATGSTPVGPGSLVSAFGSNLAPITSSAATNPPPTSLGGIRLHVRDRSHPDGWLAPLLYVSPTQINYILDSTDPYAWVDLERIGSPYVSKAMAVPIARLAPGLFTLSPSNVAAATAVRLAPDGTQTPVPVAACNASGCQPEPIDVTKGPTYLSLFGTGFSVATGAGCTIGNQSIPAVYVGPQGQFPGLDQMNLLLPNSLHGAGEQLILCEVISGTTATPRPVRTNPVRLSFR